MGASAGCTVFLHRVAVPIAYLSQRCVVRHDGLKRCGTRLITWYMTWLVVIFSDVNGCKILQNNDVIIVTEGDDLTMSYSVQLKKSLTNISILTAELYKVANSSTGNENIKIRAESRVDGDKSVEEFGRRLTFTAMAGYQSMNVIIKQENVKLMHAGKFQLYLRISEPQDDSKDHLLSDQCNIFTDVRVEERRTTPGTTDSEPPGVESTSAPLLTDSITGDTTGILSQTNLIIITIAVAFVMLVLIGLLILAIFFRRNTISRPTCGTNVIYLSQPNAVML